MTSLTEEILQTEIAEIASRLRDLRLQRGWTLDDVAKRAGLSKSYVSRLEEGDRQPSISALLSLARTLGISVSALFRNDSDRKFCSIVRYDEATLQYGNGLSYVPLSNTSRPTSMQPIRIKVPADRVGNELYRHDGEEWLYVLTGKVQLVLEDEMHVLNVGDSVYFDATIPHRLVALDGQDVEVILVACAVPRPQTDSYL